MQINKEGGSSRVMGHVIWAFSIAKFPSRTLSGRRKGEVSVRVVMAGAELENTRAQTCAPRELSR